MTISDTSPHSWTTHCLRRQRELAHTPRRRWFCSWNTLKHLLFVCNRLLIKLVTMTTSSLSAKKRSQKEDLTKSGMFTWFWCCVTWGIFIQSSTAEGNFPGVDKAAETWTWRADIGGGGGWRGQEGLGQRPHQAGIPLYTEVPRAKRGASNCKSLPFFYFLTFEKGRLLYIHPVGWLVGRLVGRLVGWRHH